MDQRLDRRLQFLSSYQKEDISVADLCRADGISRPTEKSFISELREKRSENVDECIGLFPAVKII